MHISPSIFIFKRAQPWRRLAQFGCDDVIALVSRRTQVPIRRIVGRSRSSEALRARQIAMYLAHVVLSRSLTDVGLAFAMDRTTVSHACALIEDLREDPAFDRELDRLQGLLKGKKHVA